MTKTLTQGNPAKLILLFTIPLLIGNLFQQFYNMADALIVGRMMDVNALAAVGCAGTVMSFIVGFTQGITSGFSIVTAQRFGSGDMDGVRKSVAASILLGVAASAVLTAVSLPLTEPILRLLNTPEEILADANAYLSVIFAGTVATMFFNLFSNVLRALGDSRTPLIFLAVACVINVILDYVLIRYTGLGVAGAAVATIIAQIIATVACLVFMLIKLPVTRVRAADWKGALRDLGPHSKIGFPMGFQSSIISIGQIAIQAALNSLGATSVAAYTAAQKIDTFGTMPMMSFGITMATFSAQNYGAGKVDRIRKGIRQCLAMSISFSTVIGILIIIFGRPLTQIFVGAEETEVIRLAQVYLIINCSLYFLLAILFIVRYTLQGLGKSFVPTVAGVMELGMRVFTAIILAEYFGFAGASASNPLAWVGALIPLCTSYLFTMHRLRTEHDPGRGPDDTLPQPEETADTPASA